MTLLFCSFNSGKKLFIAFIVAGLADLKMSYVLNLQILMAGEYDLDVPW